MIYYIYTQLTTYKYTSLCSKMSESGNTCSVNIKVGDVVEIKRIVTIMEIDDKKKQIQMKWKDKLGREKIQWVTYKMFLLL